MGGSTRRKAGPSHGVAGCIVLLAVVCLVYVAHRGGLDVSGFGGCAPALLVFVVVAVYLVFRLCTVVAGW